MSKSPNPIDIHVGSRVRLRRMMIGMSQEQLGIALSLTFQQVQKYEKGANRIGSSRLFTIANILDVSVQFFFDDMPEAVTDVLPGKADGLREPDGPSVMDFVKSREGLELNTAYSKIKDPDQQQAIVALMKTLI